MQQANLIPLLSFDLFLVWLSTLKSILQPTKMPVTSPGRRVPFIWPRRPDGTSVTLLSSLESRG